MAPVRVHLTENYRRPVDAIFAELSDHNRLGAILGAPVKRIRDGSPDINGVGSVRRIGMGPVAIEETVTAVEPNASIDYVITRGGFPVKDHAGRLVFESTPDGGCQVQWIIRFNTAIPFAAPGVAMALRTAIGRGLRKLN